MAAVRTYVHPETGEISLPRVLFALSEPLRLEMVRKLAEEGELDSIELGPDLPRSTLTHHTSLLRESGVAFVRAEGRKCMISLRAEDLDLRFPGLIDTVLSGYKSARAEESDDETRGSGVEQ
ncbi:ArsR/SmtB family transcription factor [Marinactinospora thermotolerans]|uniref:Transcriptional regulator, ArsR family n=1 Tax=Marinactinospora thermotolerans DSM 45154 TaxID=1122192 RepID=A0A1T4ST49_9ACTN|nr:helix-turn-helix transcriptional regulator [Marinactinospora thermotolerans]SKA31409.1 transcriptional regulator, ArsR family [Marinactinospora thermotolerans DSM 45154]